LRSTEIVEQWKRISSTLASTDADADADADAIQQRHSLREDVSKTLEVRVMPPVTLGKGTLMFAHVDSNSKPVTVQ